MNPKSRIHPKFKQALVFSVTDTFEGSGSRVRRALYPTYKPTVLCTCCFQIIVSLSSINKHSGTSSELITGPDNRAYLGLGSVVFTSPSPRQQDFELTLLDFEYELNKDPHPDVRNERVHDLKQIRQVFADYDEGIPLVLDEAEDPWKWRLVEVYGLPSWSSDNGNIVLIGDSCHAMTTHISQVSICQQADHQGSAPNSLCLSKMSSRGAQWASNMPRLSPNSSLTLPLVTTSAPY